MWFQTMKRQILANQRLFPYLLTLIPSSSQQKICRPFFHCPAAISIAKDKASSRIPTWLQFLIPAYSPFHNQSMNLQMFIKHLLPPQGNSINKAAQCWCAYSKYLLNTSHSTKHWKVRGIPARKPGFLTAGRPSLVHKARPYFIQSQTPISSCF